jgi:adhesin transport system outer membrane protein
LKGEASREYNFPFALRMGATNYAGLNNSNNVAVSVRQMIFDGFITRETVKERLQLLESANVSREKVHEQLIKFTVEVYMELRQFQQIVSAAKDNLDALHDIQHLIDLREKAGDASNVEKNYILARVTSAEKEYIDSQAALSDAFAALTFLIGDVPAFTASLPDINEYNLMDSESILQRALKNNSDIRLILSDKKAAQYDLEAAKGKFYPTVDFLVDGNQSDDLGGAAGVRRSGSAKLQLNYKLFDGGLRSSAYQLQYDKIKEIEGREKRLTRQIRQDVSKAYNKRVSSGKELKVAEQEITANRDLEKLYREQFKHGDIDIIQLVESQERIFGAQIKKSRLESDLVNVTFDLLRNTSDLLSKFCEPSVC